MKRQIIDSGAACPFRLELGAFAMTGPVLRAEARAMRGALQRLPSEQCVLTEQAHTHAQAQDQAPALAGTLARRELRQTRPLEGQPRNPGPLGTVAQLRPQPAEDGPMTSQEPRAPQRAQAVRRADDAPAQPRSPTEATLPPRRSRHTRRPLK